MWTGGTNKKGYGVIQRGGRNGGRVLVHRAAWELRYGPIDAGQNVLHRCDNPPCCRPDHLFLGSIADNNADMMGKGRYGVRPEHLPRGNAHPQAKLTEAAVRQARRQNAAGVPGNVLATKCGVSTSTMAAALSGKTWAHVQDVTR